jgi:hypothetical protein
MDAFRAIDREARVYQRMSIPSGVRVTPRSGAVAFGLEPLPPRTATLFRAPVEAGVHREAPETLAPPSIIVDESYRVVRLSELAGRYLQPAGEKERRRHDASAGWKQGRRKRAAAHRRRLARSIRSQDNFCDRTGRRPPHDRASTLRTSD